MIDQTDQTPTVTDEAIRRAHEWCDLHWPTDENQTPMADVIRHYRATVPAPPATLADELRALDGAPWEMDFSDLADRVEAVEKENRAALNHAYDERDEALVERDDARAEVDRLTAERDGAREEIAWLRNGPGHTEVATRPNPADVPVNTFWLIEFEGKHYEARRIPWSFREHHWSFMRDGAPCSAKDAEVTLVSRLVPDTRRVIDRDEDLDALSVGSVVLDRASHAWEKYPDDEWYSTELDDGLSSRRFMDYDIGPVTVIYEGVTA